ncbi:MAG: hypothetical protein JWM65_3784 [Sphingomonas bacterium]|jgi:uncharacterized protein YecT (DUF1311 family)|nr:hypothetical protein [Sphingomonas bacterium]
MRISSILPLFIVGFSATPVIAQRTVVAEPKLDQLNICTNASQVTVDILDCLADANRRDDAVLNRTYQQIMKRLDPTRQKKLRASERRWLVERKRDCNSEAGSYSTGSWWPVMYGSCINNSINIRVAWLQRHY